MGILNQSMTIGDLTAKYSDHLPLSADDGRKLGEAYRMSRRFIYKALIGITTKEAARNKEITDYHFGSAITDGERKQVSDNFRSIGKALLKPVVLKDARVLLIIQALTDAVKDEYAKLVSDRQQIEYDQFFDPALKIPDADEDLYQLLEPTYKDLAEWGGYDERRFLAGEGVRSKLLAHPRFEAVVKSALQANSTLAQVGHVRPKKRVAIDLSSADFDRAELQLSVERLNVPGARSSVHINFGSIAGATLEYLAACIIHEMSHKVVYTSDHCYAYREFRQIYCGLSSMLKVMNADCYAMAAASMGLDRLCRDHDDLR